MKYVHVKKGLILSAVFFLIIVSSFSYLSDTHGFVEVDGLHLKLNNKRYYFTGTNMWYVCYLGSSEEGRARLIRELDTLKALGITNLRILGSSEESDLIYSLKPAIQKAPGIYDDKLLEGLDFALSEIGKRKMHAVIFLNNYWQWSGGMSQYINWFTGDTVPDPDITNDWSKFISFTGKFYTIPEAVDYYRVYIAFIVNRINTVTGIKYKNDKAIMAWELANEPRPGLEGNTGFNNMESYIKWVDETAAYIHSLDPNHLVTTGTEGIHGCLGSTENFLKIHESKNIDYVNMHLWPKNWGWFDPEKIEGTYETTEKRAIDYVNLHLELARKLNKPLTFEEFGIDRDYGNTMPGTSVTARDRYFNKIYQLILDSAKNNSAVAGTNVWAWAGYGTPRNRAEVTSFPYAFLGDQLAEPQGMNSIYISDTSTINIIANHAVNFANLIDFFLYAKTDALFNNW